MEASGAGYYGVLCVGEALGEEEAEKGVPFVGRAGQTLDNALKRGRLERDGFRIANTVYCRPPYNKLSKQWYEQEAIGHCSPYLDAEIASFKPKVIVPLGAIAMRRLLPDIPMKVGITEARGYVFWSAKYECWIAPTIHPSFILRGRTSWTQVLIHDLQRARDIAAEGYKYVEGDYTLDCTVTDAMRWVDEFERYYEQNPNLYLSTDIETPHKDQDEEALDLADEEEEAAEEDYSDYTVLRCGYAYRRGHALSIPWDGPYRIVHERLLRHAAAKLFWNGAYDIPRILAQGIDIGGSYHDGMEAWHVLNSDLKKKLGFVTPFFMHGQKMWKHLSGELPAYYNAVDVDAALHNMLGTVELLRQHGLWDIYQQWIYEMAPVYAGMTKAGMPVDRVRRIESSKLLIQERDRVRSTIEQIVPFDIKNVSPKKGYVRTPKDTTGMVEILVDGVRYTQCPRCLERDPKKAHFKVYKKKVNACGGLTPQVVEEGTKRWANVVPFVPSRDGIIRFQQYMKHPLIYEGRGQDRKITTNEKAIKKLIGHHPKDEFYPLCLQDRDVTKVGGTYIGWYNDDSGRIEGGFPVGRDGRIHGHFRNTPSTLRTAMVSPNFQNLPRGGKDEGSKFQNLVKRMFVAGEGKTFWERDFSGIEAVFVGYNAGSATFYRLAKIDVHSYFTAHNLQRLGIITAADLPDLGWSDIDLRSWGKEFKSRWPAERDVGKRCIHAGDYRIGSHKLSEEYPEWFPRPKDAAMVLGLFYEVFPEIEQWHKRICVQVDKSCNYRNAFGFVHRFYSVLKWERHGNEWDWSYGDDAKRLIAFGPQSEAAFVGKRALKVLHYEHEDIRPDLRLFLHDAILGETSKNRLEYVNNVVRSVMERPIPEMPLDPAWGMGTHVQVMTDGKVGACWGGMV